MEKCCLKWNDFQTTVSQSFRLLRQEEDFYDVTLVTDDQVQVSAHKLILSACSSFFKNILKQNQHSHPLVYITGVNSTNLDFIMDYQGEVQIHQEEVDDFLDSAQKLQIAGLLTDEEKQLRDDFQIENESYTSTPSEENQEEECLNIKEELNDNTQDFHSLDTSDTKVTNGDRFRNSLNSETEYKLKNKIREILTKLDGQYTCTVCGKIGRSAGNMSKHAETHIDGLSYPCDFCEKIFRSYNAFKTHTSRSHR